MASAAAATETPGNLLPTVRLGDKKVTRLIAGGNPIAGFSHSTIGLSRLMLNYFTVERTTAFVHHLEREGINTWQSSFTPVVRDALRAAREQGSRIQYLCLSSERPAIKFQDVLDAKPIAICHHGVDTDRLTRAGQMGRIRDYVNKVRDAGLPAGVSTHDPTILARVEDAGWDVDFYMTSCYNVYRPAAEITDRLGDEILGEVYLAGDPGRMLARVRQIPRPCLAFKILAAGRLGGSKESLDAAFRNTYSNIKPTDGAIVGMFPILTDEVKEDASLARRHAGG